ncbi:hypothetical protein [Rossellomorea vietnamensis]|uniref:hypothetical protein n=1 Tax=Rossellomorea vietnamensis TaxID=218284 RepID=UPI00077C5D71|nr:hypothetical protein [Rossellomorea vietnamensis]
MTAPLYGFILDPNTGSEFVMLPVKKINLLTIKDMIGMESVVGLRSIRLTDKLIGWCNSTIDQTEGNLCMEILETSQLLFGKVVITGGTDQENEDDFSLTEYDLITQEMLYSLDGKVAVYRKK